MSIDKKKVAVELGKKIRKIRINKGLTITELAHNSEMEYKQLSRIELGKINTTVYQINKIAVSLGISITEIFDDVEIKSEK